MKLEDYIKFDEKKEIFVKIKVSPNRSKNEFFSMLWDDIFKIRIKSVAEDWKANKELISFLSKELEISKNNIEILSWSQDKLKLIKIIR